MPHPDDTLFPPTLEAARARLNALRPAAYAATRNALEGAVTRLSPYISHGVLTLAEVRAHAQQSHGLDLSHKFIQELGWRAYFHHVWQHRGDGILDSLHEGPLPDDAYDPALPADIRQGATGVPVVDQAVRQLYAQGWLHNHARLWLASYVVHLRKVHWRAGADWLLGHLLDGDLASNHLSWQWVAGTGSSKPYLFDAANVQRLAPRSWHSPRTVLDQPLEQLDAFARSDRVDRGGRGTPVAEPTLLERPPADLPLRQGTPPGGALVHAWALREAPGPGPAAGVLVAPLHRRWPWSERRWRFVHARLQALAGTPWWCDGPLPAGASLWAHPHLAGDLGTATTRVAEAAPFAQPQRRCNSFSQYWKLVGQLDRG